MKNILNKTPFIAFGILMGLILPASAEMRSMFSEIRVMPKRIAKLQDRPHIDSNWIIRKAEWNGRDEEDYVKFIQAFGKAVEVGPEHGGCNSITTCLNNPVANILRDLGPAQPEKLSLYADCAKLPYVLRAYFAFKQGLPFSYVSGVKSRMGSVGDIRYSPNGNLMRARYDIVGQDQGLTFRQVLSSLIPQTSTATFRIGYPLLGPNHNNSFQGEDDYSDDRTLARSIPDFYSPAMNRNSIRPGTVIYEPKGHVVIVYDIDNLGRIKYFDAHPDNSISHGFYSHDFVRSNPWIGAGFKNFRPLVLQDATAQSDGSLVGGTVYLKTDSHPDLAGKVSDNQFFGVYHRNVSMSPTDSRTNFLGNWMYGTFRHILYQSPPSDEDLAEDYYMWVRRSLALGVLSETPQDKFQDYLIELCQTVQNRTDAVDRATEARLNKASHPQTLPHNIYGASGDWESYSTSARDANLRRDYINLYKFVADTMNRTPSEQRDKLATDLARLYTSANNDCDVAYTNSRNQSVSVTMETVRDRIYKISFDPYHCPELRWGETGDALATCPSDGTKLAWYNAEQRLRNQWVRDTSVDTGFDLEDLQQHQEGNAGLDYQTPTDVLGLLGQYQKTTWDRNND